jgi:hypothetical protein
MSFKLEIRPLAAIEILEAYDWYELAKDGLGLEFLNELENFYDGLKNNPKTHSYYEKPVRQGRLKRFPYVVIYEIFNSTIVIYSVFMAKQDPAKKRMM